MHQPSDMGKPHAALLQAALRRENLRRAFKRVKANKAAAGIDAPDIDQTESDLVTARRGFESICWLSIYSELRAMGTQPEAARRMAANSHRWGRNSDKLSTSVLTVVWFDRLELPRRSSP